MQKQNTILVVDDSSDDVFLLRRGFEKAGISIPLDWVQNGEEAVSYLLRAAGSGLIPSILLLDIRMPVMDGFAVLNWLKTQPQLEDMPTLMLSTSPLEEDKAKAKELGAKAYFVKPTDPQEYTLFAKNLVLRWLDDQSRLIQETKKSRSSRFGQRLKRVRPG
jgi:CheY-like chemotaxis protein